MIQAQAERLDAPSINQAIGGFQSRHAAERRGNANGPAGVCASCKERHSGGHRDARSAARSARRMLRIARVPDGPEMRIVGCDAVRQFVQPGFSHHHCARRGQLLDHRGIAIGHEIGEDFRSRCGADALGPHQIFVRDRDAVQRAAVDTLGQFTIQLLSASQRGITSHGNESVQNRIQFRDLIQALLG